MNQTEKNHEARDVWDIFCGEKKCIHNVENYDDEDTVWTHHYKCIAPCVDIKSDRKGRICLSYVPKN